MKRVVKQFDSFEEAEAWDRKQQVSMTPQERMRAARAIKDRLYPPPQPDVREWHRKKVVDPSLFTADVVEFIKCLHANEVRFMVIGGEAVIFYGHVRFTGDVDFFYDFESPNTARLYKALREFWNNEIPTLTDHLDLLVPGKIFQFGLPPNRIDLMNAIDGVTFAEAWPNRTRVMLDTSPDNVPFSFIGLEDLILNKMASARHKDLDDLPFLRESLRDESE